MPDRNPGIMIDGEIAFRHPQVRIISRKTRMRMILRQGVRRAVVQKFIAADPAVDPSQFPFTSQLHDIGNTGISFQPAQRRAGDADPDQQQEQQQRPPGQQPGEIFSVRQISLILSNIDDP